MTSFDYQTDKPASPFSLTRVILDGVLLVDSWVSNSPPLTRELFISDVDSAEKLMRVPLDELEREFALIAMPIHPPIAEYINRVRLCFRQPGRERDWCRGIYFTMLIEMTDWARPWTIAEMADTLRRVSESREHFEYHQDSVHLMQGFGVAATLLENVRTIEELVDAWRSHVEAVVVTTIDTLSSSVNRDSLVTFFDFPPSVKTACQQYLVYFVQFLRDLGIQADAELKEDAHRVLFSVTPRSGPEALEVIREALDTYLSLSDGDSIAEFQNFGSDVAIQQLRANILHLQSQLMLATSILEAKNATIEALRVSNFTYEQSLVGAGTVDEKPDKEKILGGTVSITKYEGKGFEVDLPKILRMLRRRS